jgi:hypothetical protein
MHVGRQNFHDNNSNKDRSTAGFKMYRLMLKKANDESDDVTPSPSLHLLHFDVMHVGLHNFHDNNSNKDRSTAGFKIYRLMLKKANDESDDVTPSPSPLL